MPQVGHYDQHVHARERPLPGRIRETDDRDHPRESLLCEPEQSNAICFDGFFETADESSKISFEVNEV